MPILPAVEVEPAGRARSAVIWLHGLGADGHDFEPIVPYLGLDPALAVRFVFPHAPSRRVTINMGMVMPAWYDIRALSLEREVDETGVRESADLLRALITREHERGIPASRLVLAGFSQGGAIALHVALRHAERLAGIVALSTYLVSEGTLEAERSAANASTPIFQAHGTDDPMVPPARGEWTRDRLRQLDYAVEWKTYPMGHEVHPDEIRDIGRALGSWLSLGPAGTRTDERGDRQA
jgi:phospholipase/carboxylesterase